jgi:hypothetical protein
MRRTDCACHRVSIPAAFFDASASFWHCWNLTNEGKAREVVKDGLTLPTAARATLAAALLDSLRSFE